MFSYAFSARVHRIFVATVFAVVLFPVVGHAVGVAVRPGLQQIHWQNLPFGVIAYIGPRTLGDRATVSIKRFAFFDLPSDRRGVEIARQ